MIQSIITAFLCQDAQRQTILKLSSQWFVAKGEWLKDSSLFFDMLYLKDSGGIFGGFNIRNMDLLKTFL